MSAPGAARPAVFLDRDGTLIEERDFLTRPEELALLPGAADAVASLARAGFAVVLVTNQSAIARGMLDEERLAEIHALLERELARAGAFLDGIYVCPHHPTEGAPLYRRSCDCRKPLPGLLERAARELGLSLEGSWVVGDSARDLEAGAALGLPGILVATGKGASEHARLLAAGTPPEHFVPDLRAAADLVLAAAKRS